MKSSPNVQSTASIQKHKYIPILLISVGSKYNKTINLKEVE